MDELLNIEIKDGKQLVSARELHEYLEVKTRFSLWIDQYIKKDNKYGFIENVDFTSVVTTTVVNNGAKRELEDYALTIDMAKEIGMLTGTEKGKIARRYFIQCEKLSKQIAIYYEEKLSIITDRLDRTEKLIGIRTRTKFNYGRYIKNKMGINKATKEYENVKMVLFAELGVKMWEEIDYSLDVIAKIDEILEVLKLDNQLSLVR